MTATDDFGAQAFADWISKMCPKGKAGEPSARWNGAPLDARQRRYLGAVLANCVRSVSEAPRGTRNAELNKAAFGLGQFVAGAGLDQGQVQAQLAEAAIGCGLADDDGMDQVEATIASGLNAGMESPRSVPPPSEKNGKMESQEFWEATDTLRHVRGFARARRVGPWGLLGVSIARVVAVVPPTVQLPPLIGSNASLNLFFGLVATSGSFKGAAEQAAKDAFRLGPVYTTGVGSGEGINHLFGHYDKAKGSTVMDRDRVMFSVPEIDTLSALGNRNGTTLLSQLRKAWSGEALTFGYVDRNKAIEVAGHSYRLTLVAGVQPGRARTLIEDSDGGTPQRFIWLPTQDPDMPHTKPQDPEKIDLRGIADGWPGEADPSSKLTEFSKLIAAKNGQEIAKNAQEIRPHIFGLPEGAVRLIDENAVNKHRGENPDPALDGHLLLCREKVAAGLALLHNEREITDLYWDLSEVVMEVSLATRTGVEKYLAEQGDKANRARGRAEGVRAALSEEVRDDANIQRVSRNILRYLDSDEFKGEGNWSDVRRKNARRDMDYFEPAVDALVAAGQTEVVAGERGKSIRLVGRK